MTRNTIGIPVWCIFTVHSIKRGNWKCFSRLSVSCPTATAQKKSFRQESRIPQNGEMPSQNRINGASPRRCQEGLALIKLVWSAHQEHRAVQARSVRPLVQDGQRALDSMSLQDGQKSSDSEAIDQIINLYRQTRQENYFWCLCWQNLIHGIFRRRCLSLSLWTLHTFCAIRVQ